MEYPLEDFGDAKKEWSIGRNGECNIIIPLPSVSGLHATLTKAEYGYILRDAGSTNGFVLDGKKEDMIILQPEMKVCLGDAILFFDDQGIEGQSSEGRQDSLTIKEIDSLPNRFENTDGNQGDFDLPDSNEKKIKPIRIFRKGYYFAILLYSIIIFALAFIAGLIYKHYEETGDLLPYKWLEAKSYREKALDALEKQKEANKQGTVGERVEA